MGASFVLLDHPSDIGFACEASSFEELVGAAVEALATVQSGGALPAPVEEREHGVDDGDPESALVGVLEACVALLDAEDWLAVGVSGGRLAGAPLDAAAREAGTHVKAVTWHGLRVERRGDQWRATVFVDL